MIAIDKDVLEEVMPAVGGAKGQKQRRIVESISAALRATLARYEIDTPLRAAHFLAQVAHESDGFCTCEEYASGAAYEGRRDLGNTQPGDGRRYKGRGLIQLTGRANYKSYGGRIGVDLIADPGAAAEPSRALVLACEYWKNTRGGLNRFADQDDLISITKAVNGGLNGLEDRRQYLGRARQALARAAALGHTAAQPADAAPVLRRGLTGKDVETLQRALAKAGYPVSIDGDFGPGTELAVRHFQQKKKLTDDGIVGAATWRALGG